MIKIAATLLQLESRVREHISVSIVVSIPVCHTGDRGSIPRQRVIFAKDKKIGFEQIEAIVELQS